MSTMISLPRAAPASRAMIRIAGVTLIGLALLIGGGASAQSASPPAPAVVGDDVLRHGDVVRLRIWMEPELSGDFTVGELGVVVLPRLGPIPVTGEPVTALRARIAAEYGKFLNHEAIDVILLRRVQVVGAVRNPGLFHVDPSMNISDVLALAGGATPNGRADRVELIRDDVRVPGDLSPGTQIGSTPLRSGDRLRVPERGWAARNPGVVIGAASAILSFTLAIFR